MKLRIALSIPAIVVLIMLGGCGKGELSRGQTQKAIEDHIRQNAQVVTSTITLGKDSFPNTTTIDTVSDGEYKRFRESGYVNVEITGQEMLSGSLWINFKTAETERLRPYIVATVPLYSNQYRLTLKIGGEVGKVVVSGIVKQAQNTVAAEFTYEILFNDVGQKLFQRPAVLKKHGMALFILYDDGWRLTKVQTNRDEP